MIRLPYDYFRCRGTECALQFECLRCISINDVKPQTPIIDVSTNRRGSIVLEPDDCVEFVAIEGGSNEKRKND